MPLTNCHHLSPKGSNPTRRVTVLLWRRHLDGLKQLRQCFPAALFTYLDVRRDMFTENLVRELFHRHVQLHLQDETYDFRLDARLQRSRLYLVPYGLSCVLVPYRLHIPVPVIQERDNSLNRDVLKDRSTNFNSSWVHCLGQIDQCSHKCGNKRMIYSRCIRQEVPGRKERRSFLPMKIFDDIFRPTSIINC